MQYEIQAEKDEMKDTTLRSRHLTSAEKRKRNETLAIGLSRTDLLKGNDCSASDVTGMI